MRPLLLALLLAAPAVLSAETLAERGGIRIEDGIARAVGAAARSGAGYLRIINSGGADDRLVAVQSPAAARVELHAHELEDGIARMRPVEAIPVPAGGAVDLAQGGLHVMFMGLEGWQDGATIPVTLVFETAGEIELALPVTTGLPAQHEPAAGHDHGG